MRCIFVAIRHCMQTLEEDVIYGESAGLASWMMVIHEAERKKQ